MTNQTKLPSTNKQNIKEFHSLSDPENKPEETVESNLESAEIKENLEQIFLECL